MPYVKHVWTLPCICTFEYTRLHFYTKWCTILYSLCCSCYSHKNKLLCGKCLVIPWHCLLSLFTSKGFLYNKDTNLMMHVPETWCILHVPKTFFCTVSRNQINYPGQCFTTLVIHVSARSPRSHWNVHTKFNMHLNRILVNL